MPAKQKVRGVQLTVNAAGMAKIRRLTGVTRDCDLAMRIGVDGGTVSRVLSGKSAPGPKFIAGCVQAFGVDCFEDLFTVTSDEAA